MTLGSLISVVYLHHKFRQSNQILSLGGGTAKSTRSTMKELLSIAVPITLGSAGLQIINLFDTMIYMRRLTGALQWTEKMADSAKGVYNFCQTVFALPLLVHSDDYHRSHSGNHRITHQKRPCRGKGDV